MSDLRKNCHLFVKKGGLMIRAALLGAVLAHPIVFLAAFLMGMAFGANPYFGGGPAVAEPVRVFGWEGGVTGIEELIFTYVITVGLAPLLITSIGAVSGMGSCLLVRTLDRKRANAEP